MTEHLFRHESGKMVSVLTRIFGTENLESAEDVVQDTLLKALQIWKIKGIPDNPAGWLHRVAKNKALDAIRHDKHVLRHNFNDNTRLLLSSEYTLNAILSSLWKYDSIIDDTLKMMFACCHPGISPENQITLILKILCGFSTVEIARAFLTSEGTVSKRLYRAKEFFRHQKLKLEIPPENYVRSRTLSVLNAIYLLFNEGFNSTYDEEFIRRDIIDESMYLCKILTENENTQLPETYALTALICFHSSRLNSRLTSEGEIILLPDQNRGKWDRDLIIKGNEYMNKAAFGPSVSTYHLEAAIAYEHCTANDFNKTNWTRILELYNWLCRLNPSPVYELNRVVVILQLYGASSALSSIESIRDLKKLKSYYLYYSLLGEIHARLNKKIKALNFFQKAIELTRSKWEMKLLKNKLNSLS